MSEAVAASAAQSVSVIRRQLLALDREATARRFRLGPEDRLLKTTVSLCPVCLRHVPAAVFARTGRVLLAKECAGHGWSEAVLENDERFYFLSTKDHSGRRFDEGRVFAIRDYDGGGCCGSGGSGCASLSDETFAPWTAQLANKSCTVLVELTNACNLACPVCYSDARGDRKMPLDRFRKYMLDLIEQKGGLDSVQLTGGEALLHPEFWECVAFLHAQPKVRKIYIPTNGLLLANDAAADRLVAFRDKVMVLLQFDGTSAEVNETMRAANPAAARDVVIRKLERRGVAVQLTMTLTRGVNESEVGAVVAEGLRHRNVKVIALQPVTYSGRYELEPDPMERLTLSDLVKAIAAQVRPRVRPDDVAPIPCSHPNCGWITLFVRRFGLVANIMKHIDVANAMNDVAYKTLLSTDELRRTVANAKRPSLASRLGRRLMRSTDIVTIAIKPFMDRFNYDQDRIANCCHHLLDTAGHPVSFCEYNARLRQKDSWEALARI